MNRLARFALALEGTQAAPHFDRTAFKENRTYATLAADGATANLRFTLDEQELKCPIHPEAFSPVPNAWGRQGWTMARLDALADDELAAVLETAWRHAVPKRRR